MSKLMNGWVNRVGSLFGGKSPGQDEGPDISRRSLLTGAVAVVACGLVVTALPAPAAAQIEFHFGDDDDYDTRDFHRRNRSRRAHSRRRSRDNHSRRRSRGHGRRRSRGEFRDWNDNCFPTPLGWICT
jgi:hypothetical protein